MNYRTEERDVYYIPPNFLTSGRLFGGMIRVRNAIEACVLVLLTGIPLFNLPLSLTTRIIFLCLIPLPLGIFAVIGFDGDSLSEFAINWIKWLLNRRMLHRSDAAPPVQEVQPTARNKFPGTVDHRPPEQLGIKIKQPKKRKQQRKRRKPKAQPKRKEKGRMKSSSRRRSRKEVTTEDLVSVIDINHGIAHLSDERYIKILEVEPINFLLRLCSAAFFPFPDKP